MSVSPGSVLIEAAVRLVQLLPRRGVEALGSFLGAAAWGLDVRHRRLVLHNLRLALGDSARGEMGRANFRRLGRNLLLAVWMGGREDREVEGLLDVAGVRENLLPAVARGRGVVVVMFHLGNWEATARVAGRVPGVRFSTIYQPLRNPAMDRLVSRWRARSGVGLINRHHGFAEAVKCLRRGEVVSLLVDQHAGDHGMWIPFFGRFASTTILPALLARRTGATIMPLFCRDVAETRNAERGTGNEESGGRSTLDAQSRLERDRRWRKEEGERIVPASSFQLPASSSPLWRVEFGAPVSTEGRHDADVMVEIHRRLEEVVRDDPPGWFWVHDRWKTPRPNFLFHGYRRGWHVPEGLQLQPFRVLVRSSNWLGDAVLNIPLLRAIKAGRPDAHVTVLCRPGLADLWRSQRYVDRVVTSVAEARGGDFEAAVLLPNSLRSAIEAWRIGVPVRVGYAGHHRRWLLEAVCPESFRAGAGRHDVRDFCGLARWLGGRVEEEIPRCDLAESAGGADPGWKGDPAMPRVVLHPGAAHGSAKRWIGERFVELVRRCPEIRWRVIGSPEERERNAGLVARMSGTVEDWTGRCDLSQLARLLASAEAVVCNDSGPMHLAAAAGTPVIAIFGSTDPLRTGPLGTGHRVLRHAVECSPCFRRECPIDLRCMKAVTVEEVERALRDTLAARRESRL